MPSYFVSLFSRHRNNWGARHRRVSGQTRRRPADRFGQEKIQWLQHPFRQRLTES